MPHLILEITNNTPHRQNLSGLFQQLHQILAEVGGIKLENCKSRAWIADDFYIADGSEQHAFVSLQICFLEGRDSQTKTDIGNAALKILRDWFLKGEQQNPQLQITVQIIDIERSAYFKYPEGTFTPI